MTFTIVGRCARTGKLGVATATKSLAVGVRVPHVAPCTGAVAIMAIADERLGYRALKLLKQGNKAPAVVDGLVAGDPNAEFRQLGVIDDDGFAAARTGKRNRDFAGHKIGENYISLGNVLVGPHVLDAIEGGFLRDPDGDLADRLMAALEAGRDAGGQHGGQRSAAIKVFAAKTFAEVDLRVDIHREPVGELRRIYDAYRPTIPYYNRRQVDPTVPPLDDWMSERGLAVDAG